MRCKGNILDAIDSEAINSKVRTAKRKVVSRFAGPQKPLISVRVSMLVQEVQSQLRKLQKEETGFK